MPPHVLKAHFDQLAETVLQAVDAFMSQVKDLDPQLLLNPSSGVELTENASHRREITVRVILDTPPPK